jgi:hypothetical protein
MVASRFLSGGERAVSRVVLSGLTLDGARFMKSSSVKNERWMCNTNQLVSYHPQHKSFLIRKPLSRPKRLPVLDQTVTTDLHQFCTLRGLRQAPTTRHSPHSKRGCLQRIDLWSNLPGHLASP